MSAELPGKTTIIGVVRRLSSYISRVEALITAVVIVIVAGAVLIGSKNRLSDGLSVASITLTYVGFRLAVQLLLEQEMVEVARSEERKTGRLRESRAILRERLSDLEGVGRDASRLMLTAGVDQYRMVVERARIAIAALNALEAPGIDIQPLTSKKDELDSYLLTIGTTRNVEFMAVKSTCINLQAMAADLSARLAQRNTNGQ